MKPTTAAIKTAAAFQAAGNQPSAPIPSPPQPSVGGPAAEEEALKLGQLYAQPERSASVTACPQITSPLDGHARGVNDVAFSPDRTVASASLARVHSSPGVPERPQRTGAGLLAARAPGTARHRRTTAQSRPDRLPRPPGGDREGCPTDQRDTRRGWPGAWRVAVLWCRRAGIAELPPGVAAPPLDSQLNGRNRSARCEGRRRDLLDAAGVGR